MAKSDTKKDKRGSWIRSARIAAAKNDPDLDRRAIPMDEPDLPYDEQMTPKEIVAEDARIIAIGSQWYPELYKNANQEFIPSNGFFPSDEPEEVHKPYLGTEQIRYPK